MMKKYLLLTVLTLFFFEGWCQFDGEQYNRPYGGPYVKSKDIKYSSAQNGCGLSSLTLYWDSVYKERYADWYSLHVLDNSTGKWRHLKTLNINQSGKYSVTVNSLDEKWINYNQYKFRVTVTNLNGHQRGAVTWYPSNINRINAKKSNCSAPDPQPTGKPDLVFKDALIFSGCTSCQTELSRLGSGRHLIGVQSMNLNAIIVDNKGTAKSISTKVGAYLSKDKTIGTSDEKIKTFSLKAINSSGYDVAVGSIFRSDINSADGNWYVLLKIDDADVNKELNEGNNLGVIPVRLTSVFGKPGKQGPYQITIHDFSGNIVTRKMVNSIDEENRYIQQLPRQLYIVKSKNKDRKVLY